MNDERKTLDYRPYPNNRLIASLADRFATVETVETVERFATVEMVESEQQRPWIPPAPRKSEGRRE